MLQRNEKINNQRIEIVPIFFLINTRYKVKIIISDRKTALEEDITMIVVIDDIPKILTTVFLWHKKNGKAITMQIARSLVFHLNPVGGFRPNKKTLSNFE